MSVTEHTRGEMYCKECGQDLKVGDWPYCPHQSVYPERAQRFEPIVVFRASDGTYKFPGSSTDPCPARHERVEITTIQQADRITREINERERAEMLEHRGREQAHFDRLRLERGRELRAELERRGLSGRLAEAARQYKEREREQRRQQKPREVNGFFEVFAYDSSNRAPYANERTEWRSRKV